MFKGLLRPKVPCVTSDRAFLRGMRLEMPLLNLKKQGLIDYYFITNHTLFDVPEDFCFDVVWLQRISDPKLINHLAQRIDNNYLYDLDDFLIGSPSYIPPADMLHKEVIQQALQNCRVLALTSARLLKLLQAVISTPISEKTVICPNAYEFSSEIRSPTVPKGIILTQSDRLALTTSREPVLTAVADFSNKHELPMYCFGTPIGDQRLGTERLISFGNVSFWHYHTILAALPPMIGIAPLETNADQDTLDFINGKSDVKMLEYGGFGHPSVYSNAPPYVDTDLEAGIVVENTYEAWSEGLEAMYRDKWKKLSVEQEHVTSSRNMDKIATEYWYEAIDRARLPRPMTGRDIKFSSGMTGFYLNAVRHLLSSQDNDFRKQILGSTPPIVVKLLKKMVSGK